MSCAAASASCLAAGLAFASPARSDTLHAQYSVRLIGLSLGTASMTTKVDAGAYDVEVNARLAGIAAMVSNSKGAAKASGQFAQGRVLPSGYATTSANSQMTRTVRIAMTGGMVRNSEITPPFEELPGRVPVTDADRRNVVDPLSALVMPVPAGPAVGAAACNRTLPIYDGWARFNVSLSYTGTRNVETKGYKGPVSVCAARYTPIAGHRPDRPGTKFMTDNKNMEVWLAPIADSHVVAPYRISVATELGTVVIEATQFDVAAGDSARR